MCGKNGIEEGEGLKVILLGRRGGECQAQPWRRSRAGREGAYPHRNGRHTGQRHEAGQRERQSQSWPWPLRQWLWLWLWLWWRRKRRRKRIHDMAARDLPFTGEPWHIGCATDSVPPAVTDACHPCVTVTAIASTTWYDSFMNTTITTTFLLLSLP